MVIWMRKHFLLLIGIILLFFLFHLPLLKAGTTLGKPTTYTDATSGATTPQNAYDDDFNSYASITPATTSAAYLTYSSWNTSEHTGTETILAVNLSIIFETTGFTDDLWDIEYSADGGTSWTVLEQQNSQNLAKQELLYQLPNHWNWSNMSTKLHVRFLEQEINQSDSATIYVYEVRTIISYQTNAIPSVTNVAVDDSDTSDNGAYLDPIPNRTMQVRCQGVITDDDGESDILGANATFYLTSVGASAADDPRNHYTNTSCQIDTAYGTATEALATCTFSVFFYALPGQWQCNLTAYDTAHALGSEQDATPPDLRPLMAIDVDDSLPLDFGVLARGTDSGTNYRSLTIYNIGNLAFDLNLKPYGSVENDGLSMRCTLGTIPDNALRVDVTDSLADYSSFTSLSSAGTDFLNFNLAPQLSGTVGSSKNIRLGIGIPSDVAGSCSGILLLTAIPDQ